MKSAKPVIEGAIYIMEVPLSSTHSLVCICSNIFYDSFFNRKTRKNEVKLLGSSVPSYIIAKCMDCKYLDGHFLQSQSLFTPTGLVLFHSTLSMELGACTGIVHIRSGEVLEMYLKYKSRISKEAQQLYTKQKMLIFVLEYFITKDNCINVKHS